MYSIGCSPDVRVAGCESAIGHDVISHFSTAAAFYRQMLNTSHFSQWIIVGLTGYLLKKYCMVNPPERRGISV
ncbi:hypothetical protein QSF46_004956, partial [Escherichia coli]